MNGFPRTVNEKSMQNEFTGGKTDKHLRKDNLLSSMEMFNNFAFYRLVPYIGWRESSSRVSILRMNTFKVRGQPTN